MVFLKPFCHYCGAIFAGVVVVFKPVVLSVDGRGWGNFGGRWRRHGDVDALMNSVWHQQQTNSMWLYSNSINNKQHPCQHHITSPLPSPKVASTTTINRQHHRLEYDNHTSKNGTTIMTERLEKHHVCFFLTFYDYLQIDWMYRNYSSRDDE